MESANRVLTRRALDVLKSIATGEYVPPEERMIEEPKAGSAEELSASEEASPRESVDANDEAPETQRLVDPSNEAEESKSE
jgi:hypothetical protein